MNRRRLLLFRSAVVCLVALAAVTLGLRNFDVQAASVTTAPASPTCYPSCQPNDARFFSLAGSGLITFAGGSTTIGLRVNGAANPATFKVGIFDGDAGGLWDQDTANLAQPLIFELFADANNDGNPDSAVPVDTLPAASMLDDAWQYFTVNNFVSARLGGAGTDYVYLLKVSLVNPLAGLVQNNFKVAADSAQTQLFITPQIISFQAFQNNGAEFLKIHPAALPHCVPAIPGVCAPSNYDGKWNFSFLVAPGDTALNVWDGDFDIGSANAPVPSALDTDDLTTPNVKPDDGSIAALGFSLGGALGINAEGAGNTTTCAGMQPLQGCPPDDSVSAFFRRTTSIPGDGVIVRLIPPVGAPFLNLNPSGTNEYELTRVAAATGDLFPGFTDFSIPGTSIPAGLWTYQIEGMDLGNLFALRFNKILLVEPFKVGDTVFCDANKNGTQDPGDTGLPGVTVELLNNLNQVVKTTTTDASGVYSFNVVPDSWTVRIAASNFAVGGALEGKTATTAGGNQQTNAVVNANVLTYDFGYDCETTIPCPISVDPTILIVHNANGTTTVTLVQSLAVNDNSYGAGTDTTWGTKDHTFQSLLGSDKAQFVFKNGNGTVVSDFVLDYISAKPGAPSGYGSLGAAGGDGSISTGPAPVSWTTSMDDNMNIACPPPAGPWTTNSPNSPGPDPACALWEFKSIYKVTVNDSIFGASGFGGVTVPLVHNSPAKPAQTCPAACPDVDPNPTIDVLDLGTQIQVTFTQSLNANDNSYGTGTDATWGTKDHTFQSLLGSDKAQFVFKNGNGTVVSDFVLDYISAKPGAPSGYGSLGAAGGDGSISTGPAPASWTTSMDDNMNIACPPPAGPWTTNSPNSPGPDPACPTWQFKSIYKVVVNKSIFGASGFGGVTVPLVHNSPAKPPCPTAGVSQCNFTVTEREFKDKQVKITIKNNGNVDEFVSAVHLTWPAATNGKLKKVKIGGDVIYDSPDIAGGTADLTTAQLVSDEKKRKIKKGETVTVTFEFEKNVSTTLANYSGSLEFGPNCMLSILP